MPNVERTVCKFRCEKAEPTTPGSDSVNVKLYASYDESLPEDSRFSKYTPSGMMETTIVNPNLEGFFEVGKSYYIAVIPCDLPNAKELAGLA